MTGACSKAGGLDARWVAAWDRPGRRAVAWGENIDWICWYLFHNPGARYSEILRGLCAHNGVEFRPGQYCDYFNAHGMTGQGCVRRLWRRLGPGWMLTLGGVVRYADRCV